MSLKLANLVIEKIYSATTMYTEENITIQRSNRPCWAIVIKYEGETIYHSMGNTYISNIQNIAILPKGSSYEWTCTKSGHFAIIEFQCDLYSDYLYSIPTKNGEKLLRLFKNIEYKRLTKAPYYEIESLKDTYSIILNLLSSVQSTYTPSEKTKKLSIVIDYISQNYTQKIVNDELAQLTGYSTVYFRKLFTQVYGTSPMNYIANLRINKAKEMLRSDYSTITDIALSLGYANIYDFSRDFKKQAGVSPSKYMKNNF